MAIPVQSRWWIATLAIVVTLVGISALALDQPDVVWESAAGAVAEPARPHCPFCRHEVSPFSHRCGDCRGEFDWVVCPEEQSPICSDSLSVLQTEWVAERVLVLGPQEALARVRAATGLAEEQADAYLHSVGRGDCGWCGGTKVDLASAVAVADAEACPACLGTGRCIGCGGDRRIRLGELRATQALAAYQAEVGDLDALAVPLSLEKRRTELRRLGDQFLQTHAGSREAREVLFWVLAGAEGPGPTVARACRERLQSVIEALAREP
jgi:hypothetical protein